MDQQLARADELLQQARAAGDGGRPSVALRLCVRALRLLEKAPADTDGLGGLRCRLLITSAYQHSGLGHADRALAALDDAVVADPTQAAAAAGTRAQCLVRAGLAEQALVAFDSAVAGLGGGDQRLLATVLLNRGVLHMNAGRLRAAREDTEASYRAAESADDDWGAFMAAHNLGYLRFLSGDLPGALAAMEAGQRAIDDPPVGVPAMDRARVLLAAGLIREAAESSELAVSDFDGNRALSELPDALMVAAEVDLLQANWTGALLRARRAKSLNRKRRNHNAALLAELMEVKAATGIRRSRVDPTVHAAADARRAAALATALHDDLPGDATTAALLAAEALLDARDPPGATAAVQSAGVRATAPISTRLHAHLVTARLQLDGGSRTGGLAAIRTGLDELADYQARFGSQDMQAGAAIHGARLARLGLRTAVTTGSPAVILQWLERSRAVSTRLPAVHPPADAELAELLGQLRLVTLDARAAAVAGHPEPALQRRISELRRQIRSRSWTVSGSGTVQRPLPLAGVRKLLAADPQDPTVLAFVHGADEQHVLILTGRRADHRAMSGWPRVEALIRRTAADLDLLAEARIPKPVLRVAQRSLRANLAALDSELLQPHADRLTGGPVIVVAVGPLATLPWGLLPSLAGRPVSVNSSVTAAMAAVGRPSRAFLRGVLAVAGPDVASGPAEVAAVAHLHAGAGLLTGSDATGEAVLGQLPPGGLLHIAAHGHHEVESPLFSSVQLADGPLYGYDLAPSAALPDHVVLSSCDVGRSDDRPGGEPLGLAAALLRSGVSTVLAGVSRIGDEVATATMIRYHERLLAGDGPALALATAVAAADDAPAAFSCFGAGS